jgi:putative ABC transport system permease protein
VTERTRQIGILKSLGMSKASIALVFEKEALLISSLGVLLGLSVAFSARYLLVNQLGWKIELETGYILYACLGGLLSGALGALYPALRAARQDPVDALSYE